METCMFVFAVKTGECAASIQAWGSIVAILASGLIAGWQIWAAKRSTLLVQRVRSDSMVEAAAELARAFASQIESLQAGLRHSNFFVPGRSRSANFDPFRMVVASVLDLPLHEMPNAESARLLITFRDLVGTSDTAFRRLALMLEDAQQAKEVSAEHVGYLVEAAKMNEEKWAMLVKALPNR